MNYKPAKQNKKPVFVYILVFVLLVIVGVGVSVAWYGLQIYSVKGVAATQFIIEEGQGANEISNSLYETGIIKSKLAFETYLYLRDLESSIKAGTYILPSVNIRNLTNVLLLGPPPPETRVTLIEGWTLEDYAEELSVQGLVDKESFLDKVQHPLANGITAEKLPILIVKPANVDLEGYLFPDTYRFFNEVTEEQIIGALIQNLFSKITEDMAMEIDNQGKEFHDILTMASIIEKEVRTDRDRRIVSGLLWKRIAEGIPLQVDSTVNYITGDSKPAVSYDETRIDNPFNTYKYKGLPPGPIANPSLSAIMAAIYPTESNYYFYLSTPEGETIFSENLEQHAAAKNKYLR